MKTTLLWILRITAVVMIANGIWMMSAAFNWFFHIPAGLPDTGHPNGHLIRDVGLAYLIFGGALWWCCKDLAQRRPVFLCVAAFMVGHAAEHLGELIVGVLPPSHWMLDFPLVLAPGFLFAALVFPVVWRRLVET